MSYHNILYIYIYREREIHHSVSCKCRCKVRVTLRMPRRRDGAVQAELVGTDIYIYIYMCVQEFVST